MFYVKLYVKMYVMKHVCFWRLYVNMYVKVYEMVDDLVWEIICEVYVSVHDLLYETSLHQPPPTQAQGQGDHWIHFCSLISYNLLHNN